MFQPVDPEVDFVALEKRVLELWAREGTFQKRVAEYVDIDPTVVRLFTVITIVFTAIVPGILAYFVASFIVPGAPGD